MFDVIGLIGVGLIIIFYALLQFEKVTAKDISYSLGNLIGAILILFSLSKNFNLPSVVIECFWIAISVYGLVKAIKNSKIEH